jgi:hypothetical protein
VFGLIAMLLIGAPYCSVGKRGYAVYALETFSASDMLRCGSMLRRMADQAHSMEAAAARIVRYLYQHLHDSTNQPACALVRCYKTHLLSELPHELAQHAQQLAGEPVGPATKCLTLLATAGSQPAWNERRLSVGHQAIPLVSPEMVQTLPMIAQLVYQLGLPLQDLLAPNAALLLDVERHDFNVFHVPEALGCSYIPAQQSFVIPERIRSVLGFGGILPDGNLFAIILFARVPISRTVAERFRPLALNVKMSLLPFERQSTFVQDVAA